MNPFRRLFRSCWTVSVSVALFVAGVCAAADGQGERDTVRLLTVGNSFAGNALSYLTEIAEAGGKELVVFRANIGGCSLERHARHLRQAYAGQPTGRAYKNAVNPIGGRRGDFTLVEALGLLAWDVVTVQQVSLQSFRPETFEPYAAELIVAIRRHAPSAEIVIHQTWAYRPDHALYQAEGLDPERMHEGLRASYLAMAERYRLRLFPSGEAFYLANHSRGWRFARDPEFNYDQPSAEVVPREAGLYVGARWIKDRTTGEPRFATDAYHANAAGCYLAGAVWYLSLFNAAEVPAGFRPESLTAEQAAELRSLARQAVLAERSRIR